MRAGLIPALKIGYGSGWLYATMKPGRDPVEALANAFSRLKDPSLGKYLRENAAQASALHECAESALSERADQRLVLFIDQFEEVFTQLSKDSARTFINLLDHAATVDNGRVIVLFAMRSDFVPNCATYPQLNAILNQQFVQIGAMGPEELVSAIAQPALRVGLKIDPDLIAQIINDMEGEPGALPLMQFALKDLFDAEQAKGGMIALSLSDYFEQGGINQALERHANASLEKLTDQEKELAHNVFSGLIEIGHGTQDTRRTALSNELIPAGARGEAVKSVMQKLASARLITTDEATVTISHEKLIDAWPWLKKLVDENRDVIALQNQIATDAKEWEEHKRDTSYLYSGARLVNANEQLKVNKLVLSGTALQYVRAGQARQHRNRLALISAISTVIALLILAVIVFSNQSTKNAKLAEDAQKQAQISHANELSAQAVALRNQDFQLSLLLSIEAYNHSITTQSKGTLMDNAQSHPLIKAILSGHDTQVEGIAFSPDGKMLASISEDSTIILWNTETGMPIGQPLTGYTGMYSIAFSPDGTTLASSSNDTTVFWDVTTGKPKGQPFIRDNGSSASTGIAFSPDGKVVAIGNGSNTVLLDVATGKLIGKLPSSTNVWAVAFSPDGKMLAVGEGGTTLWDITTQKPIKKLGGSDSIRSVAFSPDGKTLASGGEDNNNTVRLWDVTSGNAIGQPLEGHKSTVDSVVFSPDGKTLASGSRDTTIILWNVATGKPIGQPLEGHSGGVSSVAFSPDGKTLASGSSDKNIILWDVSMLSDEKTSVNNPLAQPLTGNFTALGKIEFSPNGKILTVGDCNVSTSLPAYCSTADEYVSWDLASSKKLVYKPTQLDGISDIAYSPDSKILATVDCKKEDDYHCVPGEITLWDTATGKPLDHLLEQLDEISQIVFSPDGNILAAAGCSKKESNACTQGEVTLWDMATGKPSDHQLDLSFVSNIVFSPDSKVLATAGCKKDEQNNCVQGEVVLWNVITGKTIGHVQGYTDHDIYLAFSPDSKVLASAGCNQGQNYNCDQNKVNFWDVQKQKPIDLPPSETPYFLDRKATSPDGKTLAFAGCKSVFFDCAEGVITLWNIETGQPLGQYISHTNFIRDIAFSPDGKSLLLRAAAK